MDPQQLIWIQDPRSKITEKTSWILGLGSRSWLQEVFPKILDLGSWIQIDCYGSIVLINVYKRLQTCQNPPLLEKARTTGKYQAKWLKVDLKGGGVPHIYIYIYFIYLFI